MENLVSDTIYIVKLEGQYKTDYDFKNIIEDVEEQIEIGTINFALDLADLSFMNSSGLGVLIKILTKARTAGGEAVLLRSNAQIEQLLLMTKLNKVFKLFVSEEEVNQYFETNHNK
jgi:anti-anti-sigma factor